MRDDAQRSLAYARASLSQPTVRAQFAVRERVLAAWVARLQAQGDERSLALAARLRAQQLQAGAAPRRQAYAAGRELAQRSRDPFVVQLWLRHQSDCVGVQECEPLPLERWAEVEPGNLYAWLPRRYDRKPVTEAQWQGLAQARYARSHTFDVQARLLALLETTSPGLPYEQGLELIEAESSEWDAMGVAADLRRACAALDAASPHRRTCARAAELIWSDPQPTWGGQMHALHLANETELLREGAWPARVAQFEARGAEEDRLGVEPHFATKLKEPGCEHHVPRLQRLQALVSGGSVKASELALARRKAGAP